MRGELGAAQAQCMDMKTLAISFALSAALTLATMVILSLSRRRFGTDPVERLAGALDGALPRLPVGEEVAS